MATTTGFVPNEYLVFEADQVLTNDHLNQLFYYLDQQNRWTRNKLIGIGIVCGLNIVQHTGVIEITKGCGVTSQGYLVVQQTAKQYTYYLPYSGIDQPKDLPFTYPGDLPFYKPYDANKTIFSLLTDDDFNALEADAKKTAQTISSANAANGLIDYAVVLFVEAGEQDLKNCDMFDCNNKGEKMMINLRALLVRKSDLPGVRKSLPVIPVLPTIPVLTTASATAIKPTLLQPDKEGLTAGQVLANRAAASLSAANISTSISGNVLSGFNANILFPITIFSLHPPEINLKRFNVPYTDIKTTDDVINAFVSLVDDGTLSAIASAYTYCYNHYKDVLDESATGFPALFNDLKAQRDLILKNNPVFIQYFYDYIDDLTKAYYEFRSKVSLLLSACCPDENKFPLHLVLGAATANTKDFAKDVYRTYFIYSPLFARQENEISETQFLFRRMQILVSEFTMITADDVSSSAVKILPGLYKQAPLSQRVIPYYYTVNEEGNELYKYWNYNKTIRSDEAMNLSYNADQYSGNTAVRDPLLYDIEKYNFFRIEGHIGTNYQAALTTIIQQRKTYNLPFDVVAVSADQLANNTATLPQCNIQDLDTDFKLLISGFTCKVHIPFCFITKLTNPPTSATTTPAAGGVFANTGILVNAGALSEVNPDSNTANLNTAVTPLSFSAFKLQNALTDKILINPGIFRIGYRKGDFMRKYCAPAAGVVTIGSVYLASIINGVFTNPVPLNSQSPANFYYYRLFEYVDAVESLMQVLMPATLTTLDMDAFTAAYKRFADSLLLVTLSAAEVMNDKLGNSDNTTVQFLKDIEMDKLVNEIGMPVYDCLDERLQTLISEYANRLQQYQNQLSFLSYYNKHYGLEHKAGVPKGGTFVLVYRPAAPATTSTGTTAGTTTNTGVFTPVSPQTGMFSTGVLNTGFINTGILKTGILKTSAVSNPVITGARLFMAKAPKKTPEKKNEKAAAKEDKQEIIEPKDTAIRGTVLTATTGVGTRPVTAGTVINTPQQTVITGTRPVAEQPVVATVQPATNFPIAEQPINPVLADQPVIAATQPVVVATQPILNQPVIIATQPIADQPVVIETRPPVVIAQPTPVETRPPVAAQPVVTVTKLFQPVVISTQPGRVIAQAPTIPILQQPTRIPVLTNFPPIIIDQPQAPVSTRPTVDVSTLDLINNFANASADLSSDNKKTILDFLNQAKQQLAASRFNIADNVVIADFYVPYLCCSDCPPVAYIVQQSAPTPPPSEAPSFDITPKEFLFDDAAKYPFTLKPPVTDANKAADPFTSGNIINPGNLHLSTDDKNVLFLQPAMPNLTVTTTATIAYQNLPVDITIIKPDATFVISLVTEAAGNAALQVIPADANADTYKWTVNGVESIFENSKAPAAISIDEIRNKVQTSPFTIALTLSYTRNNKTSADTKQQVYQPSVCIDFDSFELNTEFGSRVGQKEGDVAFTTTEKIVATVLPLTFPRDSSFGVATIVKAPSNLGDGQCLQMNTIDMKFDYSQSNIKPVEVTVEFLNLQGIINLSVNDSDMFTDDISKLPKQFKDVKVSIDKAADGSAMLVLKGNVTAFTIGGQQFFIDNVCAQ